MLAGLLAEGRIAVRVVRRKAGHTAEELVVRRDQQGNYIGRTYNRYYSDVTGEWWTPKDIDSMIEEFHRRDAEEVEEA